MNGLANGSLRLFRVFGITVYLHWSWFVVAFFLIGYPYFAKDADSFWLKFDFIGWSVAAYVALFAVVLVHEFGHALACRQVGGKAERIILWPLGGLALVQPPPRPGAMLWTAAAGPLVNVVLLPITALAALLGYAAGLSHELPDAEHFLIVVAFINATLLAFNLLPIFPLDGGQILHALLWFVMGRGRSLVVSGVIGLIGAAGFALAGLKWDPWLLVLAGFMGLVALVGLRQGRLLVRIQPGLDLLNRANDRIKQGDYAAAAADCTAAVEQFEHDPGLRATALVRRGAAHLLSGDHAGAIDDYTEALEIGEHPLPYLARGEAHLLRGARGPAVRDLTAAIRLDPRCAPAYVLRGDACAQSREFAQAVRDYSQALALDPGRAETLAKRGAAGVGLGRFDRAVADYTEALRLGPTSDLYNQRAIAYRRAGRTHLALADYDAAIGLAPAEPRLYFNRALAHAARGDYGRAVADYAEAARLAPDYAAAYNNLAHLWATCPLAEVRDGSRAVGYATRACELTAWGEAGFLDTLAAAYAEAGDFAEAARWQSKALEDPQWCKGREEKARERLRLYEEGKPYRATGPAGGPVPTPAG
jgi:tetratricopeptide (TPR) repeat protein/Zn-dependent protease